MGRTSLIVFLLLLCHLGVHSLSEEEEEDEGGKSHKDCPSFSCGKLGLLKFPFVNTKNWRPECGFLEVDGCDSVNQTIQLEKGSGRWYPVSSISQGGTIRIRDDDLGKRLSSNSCQTFSNLTFPRSPFVSFHINPNLTFLTCHPSVNLSLEPVPANCNNSRIYYAPSEAVPLRPPPQCELIQLPVVLNQKNQSYSSPRDQNISALLTADFTVDVVVSRQCKNCYHHRHGVCLVNRKQEFRCSKKGKKKLGLPLGLGIGNGVLLMLIVVYLLWRYRERKRASSKLLSSNSSSDHSFKDDLEGGNVYFGVPVFSYRELEAATSNFGSEKEIGEGGFGTVYFGKLGDGREVAVKRMYEHNYRRVEQFMNEIKILTRMHHKNLVSLYGCTSRRSKELLLVYEYIANGTVADHLHGDRAKSDPLTWPIRMSIAIETASALAYLHASDIIHRDVKTNNILLDDNCSVKVADFGLSRLFPSDRTHVSTVPQGTPGYVDPEYHQCYQLTDKSDVYSFGVVLIELISSMPAVDISRNRSDINLANLAIRKIKECAVDELIDPWLDHETNGEIKCLATSVAELAFRCLQMDKDMRPTMVEVVEKLTNIQSENSKCSQKEDDMIPPSPSPDQEHDEDPVTKNVRHLPSPISVTDKWASTSSIATTFDTSG